MTGFEETFPGLEFIAHIQICILSLRQLTDRKGQFPRCAWRYGQIVHNPLLHHASFAHKFPDQPVGGKVAEVIFIEYADTAGFRILEPGPDVLVMVSHLIHVRVRHAVRTYETVVAEIVV